MKIQSINENNIEHEVERIVEEQLLEEKKNGTPLVHFLTYANMLKELLPLSKRFDCYDIWKKYRKEVMIEDWYKQGTKGYNQKDYVIGIEKILEHIDEGGFIYSFHYGNYRSLYLSIFEKLEEVAPNKKLMMIVDQASYDAEPEYNKNNENFKYFVSQDLSIAFDIMEYIDRGDWVAIFLDGNSGTGKNRNPMLLKFLSSNIQIRSGIFQIMVKSGKAVFPILAEGAVSSNVFRIYDNININATSQVLADRCYEVLRKKMIQTPEYWRLWDRLHSEVVNWSTIDNNSKVELTEVSTFDECGVMKIDKNTGKIYRIKSK